MKSFWGKSDELKTAEIFILKIAPDLLKVKTYFAIETPEKIVPKEEKQISLTYKNFLCDSDKKKAISYARNLWNVSDKDSFTVNSR